MTRRQIAARLKLPAIIAMAVIALDQLTKALVLQRWPQPQTGEIELLGQWLALTYVRNDGVAFGLFQGVPQLFTVTSLVIVAGAIYFYLRHEPEQYRWAPVTLGLIVGGALGNAIDRAAYGAVFDFIHLHAGRFSWYVFNIADAAIVAGVVGLILDSLVAQRTRPSGVGGASG